MPQEGTDVREGLARRRVADLRHLDEANYVYAHRLFQCLVVALRPLRVEELAEFLAFEFEDGERPIYQADCRLEDPREAVLSTCSGIVRDTTFVVALVPKNDDLRDCDKELFDRDGGAYGTKLVENGVDIIEMR